MRNIAIIGAVGLGLAACSDQGGGQGFELYEVTPSGAQGPTRTDLQMQGLPAVPMHTVASAATPNAAVAIRPYRSDPGASVAAIATENTWLRLVEDDASAWLVAEAGSGNAPDAGRLRSEVQQRSGCLVAGSATTVGRSTVFPLDCS